MSARSTAPVVGFNHNVKHGQRVYHVQTEDSGLPHAHFITHLFLGGNIVATQKSSYADRAGGPDLAKVVRGMMEEQHKNMLRRLVAGDFREMSERLSAPHYEPGVLATGQTGPAAVNVAPAAAADPRAVANRSGLKPAPTQSVFASSAAGTKVAPPKLAAVPVMVPATSAAAPRHTPPTTAAAPRHTPPATAAASRHAAPATSAAAPRHAAPTIPSAGSSRHAAPAVPPAAAPRHAAAAPVASRTPAIARPEKTPEPIWEAAPPGASNPAGRRMPGAPLPQTTRVPPAAARSSVSPPRLAPSVSVPSIAGPASELLGDQEASGAEQDGIPTLFAEELISEKSLDEVILAFLSADLEPHK